MAINGSTGWRPTLRHNCDPALLAPSQPRIEEPQSTASSPSNAVPAGNLKSKASRHEEPAAEQPKGGKGKGKKDKGKPHGEDRARIEESSRIGRPTGAGDPEPVKGRGKRKVWEENADDKEPWKSSDSGVKEEEMAKGKSRNAERRDVEKGNAPASGKGKGRGKDLNERWESKGRSNASQKDDSDWPSPLDAAATKGKPKPTGAKGTGKDRSTARHDEDSDGGKAPKGKGKSKGTAPIGAGEAEATKGRGKGESKAAKGSKVTEGPIGGERAHEPEQLKGEGKQGGKGADAKGKVRWQAKRSGD
mmetsp:Transcript_35503/g.81271  ORF Transcript_35503/g.81271 Transcript_35503/m.81271 type:complete len:304 (-) Transcript_35503:342-1253(-)